MRAELLRSVRSWFEAEGFIEVEPSCLQVSPGNETHLHAFRTHHITLAGEQRELYLHTSPEFAMKKLLAAGEDEIFAISRVFRNRERGALNHTEFTMIEWYRAGQPYDHLMADCTALLARAKDVRGTGDVTYRERRCDLTAEPERLTVADAFRRFTDINILGTLTSDPNRGDAGKLSEAARHLDLSFANDDTWSDIFAKILTSEIEPRLGIGQPTFLVDYPLPEAALARAAPNEPRVGQRFELYCCGIELANGFAELTDAREQRRRFEAAMDEKDRIYGERYPIDESFLAALAAMPKASGIALGFDRLALLTAGVETLDQIVWTPEERVE